MSAPQHPGRAALTSPPLCDSRIEVLRPSLPDAERLLSYLRRIDANRTYTNWGPLVSELEVRLAQHFSLAPGAVTSAASGTSALVGAILASARSGGADRTLAIVPAFTFVATALATEQCRFQPHLADIDSETWQLDAEALRDHPRLRDVGVVVPVAPFGRAVPQAPWLDFRRRTGIPVVIDGAASFEAIGADPARFIGEIPVVLSFHATKSYSTAEGGAVVTTDERLSLLVRQALNFGFSDSRECRTASTNGKMSEYHAAVGLAELDVWQHKQAALLEVAGAYRREATTAGLADRVMVAPEVASCYALFRGANAEEAAAALDRLEAAQVDTRLWYAQGLHRHAHFTGRVSCDDLPVTDRVAPLTIGLPIAIDLSDTDVSRIVATLARAT